jgi:hypothetical protein
MTLGRQNSGELQLSTHQAFAKEPAAADRLCIVVLGYIVRGPIGGLAWHHLQYVMGLAALGHDVFFLEDSDDYAGCYDPSRHAMDIDATYGLEFATKCFNRVGLRDRWAYHDAHQGRWFGPCARSMFATCVRADLILNLSGMNPLRPWCMESPVRVFVDTDPVFTQIRHLQDPVAHQLANQHTTFFSFGENIGRPTCTVPDDGFPWRPTRQPIVLEAWPISPGPRHGRFTTVMQWESYNARVHDGRRYGMKSDSFEPFGDLPRKAGTIFELAVGSASAPRERLLAHGWKVRNPLEVARDPWSYQHYLRESRAEFGVAKHGYVMTRSGWFSERSAAYLASGRPVVVQDTGFTDWLPTGRGLLAFEDVGGAIAAIECVNSDYEMNCRAARAVAEEFFDSNKILNELIEQSMESSRSEAAPTTT